MNKTPDFDDEMLPEYQFDYRKAKPNRFAQQQSINAIAFSGSYGASRSVAYGQSLLAAPTEHREAWPFGQGQSQPSSKDNLVQFALNFKN
ncbi:MAG: hypothetical protein F6K53_43900 [Moorea sp. SIO4A1]|uniref:hypothetical protein n=1 Tax=Moorena sp. SIO4A1 TaxID=2607835 RepID=UPI00144E6D0C|nr:hypothetical protein [Moorena sp. SIO4A1]NEQ63869.1 hypothetical protein [Moorena sp. SIO4A1]